MPSLQIFDIAIGLMVIYATLALACTAANEFLAQFLGWRAKTLAAGIRQILADGGTADKLLAHPMVSSLGKGSANPSYLHSTTFALALIDTVANQGGKLDLAAFQSALQTELKGTGLGRALTLMLDRAGNDLERLTSEIENWYDDATDRFSGWYKRKVQLSTLLVAALFCGFLNADTTAITQALANNATLRASVAAYAESYAKTAPSAQPDGKAKTDDGKITQDIQTISQSVNQLHQLGIPLGWKTIPKGFVEWSLKFFGLLTTILAVSLGAPFWFDLLSRFVNIRAAGAAPKKTTEGAKT